MILIIFFIRQNKNTYIESFFFLNMYKLLSIFFFYSRIQELFGEGQLEVITRAKISVAMIKKIATRVLERMEYLWSDLQNPGENFNLITLKEDLKINPPK